MGKQYEESKKYFEIAKKIDKANPWYHYWYGQLLISDHYKQYEEGIKCFDQCLKLQATHHKCRYEYACLLYNTLKRKRRKNLRMDMMDKIMMMKRKKMIMIMWLNW